ncbi:MAG: hypothetical protein U0905_18145 [Pirellulales bacterium]
MMRSWSRSRWSSILLVSSWIFVLTLVSAVGLACQVPVFRYALERWLCDRYEVWVVHDGALDPQVTQEIANLREKYPHANCILKPVSIQDHADGAVQVVWKQRSQGTKTLAVWLYPQAARDVPSRLLVAEPWSTSRIRSTLDSPVRQEIGKRLLDGQSAIWIFIAGGNASKDAEALQRLRKQLELCQEQLTLPTLEEMELDPAELERKKIHLRVEFSVIALKRDDAAENALIQMLLQSEDDLSDSQEPLAFPVFGRGRVLYALQGEGIRQEQIEQACKFVIGPCSCQVKQQNPGFDLLLNVDWEGTIGDSKISDPLPEEGTGPKLIPIPSGKKRIAPSN